MGPRITFHPDKHARGWWVRIEDNGLGIPTEQHRKVFEPFFRGQPDRAEGSGLGLAIVQEAVEQLGGEIQFFSEPGSGTTFAILLRDLDQGAAPEPAPTEVRGEGDD